MSSPSPSIRQPRSPSSSSDATTTVGTDRSAGACTDDVELRTCRPGDGAWPAASAGRSRAVRSGRAVLASRDAVPGGALDHVQRMLARVAQRPQLAWRGDDDIQRRHRQPLADPARRGADARPDIPAVSVDLLGDQREVALRVRVAQHELAVGAQLVVQPRELAEAAVVRHDPAAHRERVGVAHGPAAGRGPPHVGDERRRDGLLRLADELLVGERRLGLLIENGLPGLIEVADPASVDVAAALHGQRVRGVDQPERRADRPGP